MDCPEQLEERGIDVKYMFGNLSEVIGVSEQFLTSLQPGGDSGMPGVVKVAGSFLQHSAAMKRVYTQYCLNHDKAEQLLEKFDGLPEMQKVENHFQTFFPSFS